MEGSVVGGYGALAVLVKQWVHDRSRIFHHYLNKIRPYPTYRWIGTLAIAAIYALRVYYTRGFVWTSYALLVHLVALLVLFLSPLHDPKKLEVLDGPLLPMEGSDEFKPFIRFLPAFKLWCLYTLAICVALMMTFFPVFEDYNDWRLFFFKLGSCHYRYHTKTYCTHDQVQIHSIRHRQTEIRW